MGSPSSGSKVQTTMPLSKGKHQQSHSAEESLQLEKLGQLENQSSAEKLSSSAALSPRTTEEQSITAFLGDKRMKRRAQSSQGLELINGVALGADERKPLSSVSFGGHRRGGSGSMTPKASGSPRMKGMCSSPGVDKYAVVKIAPSLFHSPTKLERSMSLSRVAHRVVADSDGSTPRSRTGVSEVILPDNRDTFAELKQQDSQRELEGGIQALVAHRNENGSSGNSCSQLLEKKVEGNKAYREQTNAIPFSCSGSGALLAVKGGMPCANGDDENSHPKTDEVPIISIENPSHGSLGSTEDSWPNGEYRCSNAAQLPVKDIHPVCFETTNKPRTEQALIVSVDMGHDLLHQIARSYSASTQEPYLSRGSNCNGPELVACEPLHLELQSENLSNGTHPENSHRISHPDVLPTSNSCPAGTDLSYQVIKEVSVPRTSEAFHTKVLVCDQLGSEVEKNAHSVIAYSSDKVYEAGLTKAAVLSSLVCENDSVLSPEESKQVDIDASQCEDVKELHFSAEKEVGFRRINVSDACFRKGTSFELGEKKTTIRKRRRSVSASEIGAMLLKIVRTSEPGPVEARSIPRAEIEVSDASPLLPTANLHQDAQFETETNNIEAVDMDVEYEDCSSELVAAAEIDIDCRDGSVEYSSENKDTKRPSEEVMLQLVDETQLRKIKNCTQEEDQTTGSGSRSFNDECDKRVISLETTGNCNPRSAITADSDQFEEPQQLEETFLDARDKSLDRINSFENIEISSPSILQAPRDLANQEIVVKENANANGHKGNIDDGFSGNQRRRRHGSRGRMSHDLDSSTVAIEESRRSLSLVDENLCMITSLERSRSFASMLQVSPRQSVDESTQSRLAPSSIAILTNPSFSSSHQDRLWEEQAEYSSGGRGTPGRDDDYDTVGDQTPSPSGAISSEDQIRSTAASLRKSQETEMSSFSCSGFASDSGRSHEKRKLGQSGKKRGRPLRSPLRSLLAAEDSHDENQRSPERHHFLKQILSRIRGKSSSPKSSPHKSSSSQTTPKRRCSMIWSSCMCFSHVNP